MMNWTLMWSPGRNEMDVSTLTNHGSANEKSPLGMEGVKESAPGHTHYPCWPDCKDGPAPGCGRSSGHLSGPPCTIFWSGPVGAEWSYALWDHFRPSPFELGRQSKEWGPRMTSGWLGMMAAHVPAGVRSEHGRPMEGKPVGESVSP